MINDEDIKAVDKAIHELIYITFSSKFMNEFSDKTNF